MCRSKYLRVVTAVLLSATMSMPLIAQDSGAKKQEKPAAAAGQPSESDMMAMMMEMAKPGDNHKMLARGVGTWTYAVKMWMSPDPGAAPMESSGTTVAREALGGRYIITEHTGKMQMPGADGKMTDMEFKGMSTEGYDNMKKKFVATWIDNMGTGIMTLEGTYDAATKSLTYLAEYEMMPGMKTKVREVLKMKDNDHRVMEWYEDRGGTEVKTMEITYTRKT
jgi:hypothetical protein